MVRCRRISRFAFFALTVIASSGSALETRVLADEATSIVGLTVEPATVTLSHADDSIQFVVTARLSDGSLRDVTRGAQYAFDQPGVAAVTQGRLFPKGNGTAVIQVSFQDSQSSQTNMAEVRVEVKQFDVPRPLNFAVDIVPVLSKLGCNSGGCHGKAIGQNGFKLSLFGFDPDFDFAAIVEEGLGRRVSPAAPDDSLILLKGTGAMPHGGGVRLSRDSEMYGLLRRWLEQGLPPGRDDEPRDVKLEVTPSERVLHGKTEQQLRVVVHYSDGTTRDVTQVARFDTQQPDLLTVTPEGFVQTTGRAGETSVMVRYQNSVGTARIMSLTRSALPDAAYAAFQPKNFIDELLLVKWRKLHISPSAAASDAEFIRRVFVDALGTLPTPQEVRDFEADGASEKRDSLIERVVEREEYYDLWAHRMGDLLRNRSGGLTEKANTVNFAKWIRQSLVENKPYDQFVREIITVSGKRADHPQMDWYRWAINPENRVEDSSQAFLGMRVSCANCHDHPFEKVRQTDYWRFAAFFSRMKTVSYGSVDDVGLDEKTEIKHPRTEKVLTPKAFGGPEFEYVKGEDPRQKLAEWMTAPDNPFFARAISNRIWGHYMGVGLVEPVDDMRATNPPSNPELLDALARDLVDGKFDLKHLMKTILKSRAYGLSSVPTEDNAADGRNHARFYARRMAPHVLLDAISSATGTATKFDDYPDVKKAILLPNEDGRSDFLQIFGRSKRVTPCECETSIAPNLSQVLYLLNSDEMQRQLASKNGVIEELVKSGKNNGDVVEDLFLRTFSRRPLPAELQEAVAQIEKAADRRMALEDVLWTLLNSKEFLFNH